MWIEKPCVKDTSVSKEKEEEVFYSGFIREFMGSSQVEVFELPPEIEVVRRVKSIPEAIKIIGRDKWEHLLKMMYVDAEMSMRAISRELHDKPVTTIHDWLHRMVDKERIPRVRPGVMLKKVAELTPYMGLDGKTKVRKIDKSYLHVTYVYPDPDLCYIIGFCLGNGCVDRSSLLLFNTEWGLLEPILEKATKVAEKFRVSATATYHNMKHERAEKEEAYYWKIGIWSTALARMISDDKEWVKEQTLNVLLQATHIGDFLAGFWDADGYVNVRPRRIDVGLAQSESHLPLFRKIEEALRTFGIKTYEHKRAPEKCIKIYGKSVSFREPVYVMYLSMTDVPKWLKLVAHKLLHPRKTAKVEELKGIMEKL